MRANILYGEHLAERAVTPKENSSEAKATEKGGNRQGGGEKGGKKSEREKNGQSLDGSACPADIALHAGLKTSARNIATAKALICNLLPLPSAFYRATFPRMRRWNGTPKRSKDNTVKTQRLSAAVDARW